MKILNRRAKYNFEVYDKVEAGIVLTGGEVKSLLAGKASLDEAFVKIINGELLLINAHIHPYEFSAGDKDPRRSRKLLLHKTEILNLENKMRQKNFTIVPLMLYTNMGKIKVEIALAKGKKEYEKKEVVKKRDILRKTENDLAGVGLS